MYLFLNQWRRESSNAVVKNCDWSASVLDTVEPPVATPLELSNHLSSATSFPKYHCALIQALLYYIQQGKWAQV